MDMIKKIALSIAIMSVLICASYSEGLKQEDTYHVLRVISEINDFAKKRSSLPSNNRDKEIDVKLDAVLADCTSNEIGKIAVICWTLYYPGNAEDVNFDRPFYRACWRCITRLSEKQTISNLDELCFIRDHVKFSGGEKMALEEVIDRLEKSLRRP